jgi:hypothetical protein
VTVAKRKGIYDEGVVEITGTIACRCFDAFKYVSSTDGKILMVIIGLNFRVYECVEA